ncbi:MAG: protoporphyrinogen oxidase [Deltaproteobacteria bacterium]|nr:protoporphyrinogen oxidase [Deltaproteobacteria bacterium]
MSAAKARGGASGHDADVIVVGGGLAGLAAAHRLARRGVAVRLVEAGARLGGNVATARTDDGFLFERGPNAIRGGSVAIESLIAAAGLAGDVIESGPNAKARFIWRGGKVHAVPSSPPALVRSELLSGRAKLRMLAEPFVKARPEDGETLGALLTRRIGRGAVEALVDPLVSGIFAGDVDALGPDALSLVKDAEREHGSLFKALVAARRKGGKRASGMATLRRGLDTLPTALGAALGEAVRLETAVGRVAEAPRGVVVELAGGGALSARAAIVATPARAAGELLGGAAAALGTVPHPAVATVSLGVADADLRAPFEGFGVLRAGGVPIPGAGPVIGMVFGSSVFEGRAPAGHRAFTAILGGARHPGVLELTDEELTAHAAAAVDALMGLRGGAKVAVVTRWPLGIPQFTPRHLRRIKTVRAALPAGVALAGSYLDAIGMEPAVGSGFAAADAVAARVLERRP